MDLEGTLWDSPWKVPLTKCPVTLVLLTVTATSNAFLRWRKLTPLAFTASYARVIRDRGYWRIFSTCIMHGDMMRLLLCLLALWGLRDLEALIGSWEFLKNVLLLLLLTNAIYLGGMHAVRDSPIIASRGLQQWHYMGLSGVLVGLVSVQVNDPYYNEDSNVAIFSLFKVPVDFACGVFAFLIQFVPLTPCFINVFCGLVGGYALTLGLFDWVTPYFTFCIVQWCILLVLVSDGFPPQLETEEVVQQRIAEEIFAVAARSRSGRDSRGADPSSSPDSLSSEPIRSARDIVIEVPERFRTRSAPSAIPRPVAAIRPASSRFPNLTAAGRMV